MRGAKKSLVVHQKKFTEYFGPPSHTSSEPGPTSRSDCEHCAVCQSWRDSGSGVSGHVLQCGHTDEQALWKSRPCVRVSCHHNLYLDVSNIGSIVIVRPDIGPDEAEHSCSLDEAGRGGMSQGDIGNVLNLTRQRAEQMEADVIRRAKLHLRVVREELHE